MNSVTKPQDGRSPSARPDRWIGVAAVAAPVATAAALIPWRGQITSADGALVLVVVIVAVAGTGRRVAAVVAALTSALAFDFFLTRPYGSLRVSSDQDLTTEVLLLVVGLAVGELAARGRAHRVAVSQRTRELALLHSVTELAASGQDSRRTIDVASDGLQQLLSLRSCHFTSDDPGVLAARITPEGAVVLREMAWTTEDLGLPTRRVDLPVRGGGWLLGHFLLTPTPGEPVSRQQLAVAVAIADQVGASLVADRPIPANLSMKGRTTDMTTSEHTLRGTHA